MTSKNFFTCLALMFGPTNALAGCAFDLAEDGAPVEGEVGGVAIELRWTGGREFDFVEWTLETDDHVAYAGSFTVDNDDARFVGFIGHIDPTDYVLVLKTQSTDGTQQCRGRASVSVVANETAQTNIALLCSQPDQPSGSIQVDAFLDDCTGGVGQISAAPTTAQVGETVTLEADIGPGFGPVQWTADVGTVDVETYDRAHYTCTEPGNHVVTLFVAGVNEECADNTREATITCQ